MNPETTKPHQKNEMLPIQGLYQKSEAVKLGEQHHSKKKKSERKEAD